MMNLRQTKWIKKKFRFLLLKNPPTFLTVFGQCCLILMLMLMHRTVLEESDLDCMQTRQILHYFYAHYNDKYIKSESSHIQTYQEFYLHDIFRLTLPLP